MVVKPITDEFEDISVGVSSAGYFEYFGSRSQTLLEGGESVCIHPKNEFIVASMTKRIFGRNRRLAVKYSLSSAGFWTSKRLLVLVEHDVE